MTALISDGAAIFTIVRARRMEQATAPGDCPAEQAHAAVKQ